MQQVAFPLEVVIGDDNSSDKTLSIIKSFIAENYKANITYRILDRVNDPFYTEQRKVKGRLYNFADILNHCKGKYIALCDGDDYWTDPNKLQKQVNFLEENHHYAICYHRCTLSNPDIKADNQLNQDYEFLSGILYRKKMAIPYLWFSGRR